MQIQRDFLNGKLPVPVAFQVTSSPSNGYRWKCPDAANRAEVAGSDHVRVHASQEDVEELEKMKVLRIPEELLAGYHRARRDALIASEGSTD